MVPDSLAIASFAWGLGHLIAGGTPSGLAEWNNRELSLKRSFRLAITANRRTSGKNGLGTSKNVAM